MKYIPGFRKFLKAQKQKGYSHGELFLQAFRDSHYLEADALVFDWRMTGIDGLRNDLEKLGQKRFYLRGYSEAPADSVFESLVFAMEEKIQFVGIRQLEGEGDFDSVLEFSLN